jgi:ABC-2 type transport system permease protein
VRSATTKPTIGRLIHRYWTLCKVSFQERMEFRWNILMYMSVAVLPALVAIYLWSSVYNSQNNQEGLRNIVTYYIVAAFVGWRIHPYHWNVMWEILQGRMATALLRPMSFPARTFWYEAGGRMWSTTLTTPFFVIFAIAMGSNFKAPDNIWNWVYAIVAFTISYVMYFFMTFTLGLLAIWQNQPEGFFVLFGVGSQWLGGTFVPLALMPDWISRILEWLPFAYVYSLPVKLFMGLPPEAIWQGFGVQLLWLAISYVIFKLAWQKAVTRFEVYEG